MMTARSTLWLAVVTALLGVGWMFMTGQAAQAALGNTGLPVRCSVALGSRDLEAPLTCRTAHGNEFTKVPSTQYLLVTDMIVEVYTTTSSGSIQVNVQRPPTSNSCIGTVSPDDYFEFPAQSRTRYSEHFTTPYLIVPPNGCLFAAGITNTSYAVKISGLLVTNVTFLPLSAR